MVVNLCYLHLHTFQSAPCCAIFSPDPVLLTANVTIIYCAAALLRCALDDKEERKGGSPQEGTHVERVGARRVTSVAKVSRQCSAIMKACVGLGWEAELDVQHWLREMEKLKVQPNPGFEF